MEALDFIQEAEEILKKDPVSHLELFQGIETLEPYQKIICKAVSKHERVAIAACHDLGKSFILSRVVLWFGSSFRGAKIITTAPTFNQVQRILWSEIRTGHRQSKVPLGGQINLTEWKIDDDWFALGFSPQKNVSDGEGQGTSSSFQGFHGDHVLVVFDEATGIPPQIWTQAEGLLTSASVKFVAIGNPTSKQSEFYKCFQSPLWHKIKLSCFDSPNLKANGIEDMASLLAEMDQLKGLADKERSDRIQAYKVIQPKLLSTSWVLNSAFKWGIQHPLFQSKVLGEFPEEDEHVLMPLGLVELAQRREASTTKPTIRSIGVDPARFGSDKTVITEIDGTEIKTRKILVKNDTTQITGELVRLILDLERREREIVVIDGTGIGAGVVDQLKEKLAERALPSHLIISERHFGSNPVFDKEHYANFKAEIFLMLSHDLKKELCLPKEATIYQEQLPTLLYAFDSKGRYIIESKDDYKKRTGLSSPDDADSLALANFGRYDTQNVGEFTDDMVQTHSNSTTFASELFGGDSW